MKAKSLILAFGLLAMLTACHSQSSTDNPLLVESTLDFYAPAFDRIKPEHFLPALKQGIAEQSAEIDSIVNNPEAPTFENTILAFEKSGRLLTRTSALLSALSAANGTDELRKVEEEATPLLSAHSDALMLNDKLFARVKAVHDTDTLLKDEDLRLTEVLYQQFVHEGALLSPASKDSLSKINGELSVLETKFVNQVRDATNAAALLITDAKELDGLSQENIDRAAKLAEERGQKGKYLLEISNTTRPAYIAELNNRDVRRRLLEASLTRASRPNDPNNTEPTLTRIAELRADKAKLLGYPTFAAWVLSDQMAGEPAAVYRLIEGIAPAYRKKVQADAAELEAFARKTEGQDFKLEAWDWDYYAERLKKEKFDLNENDLKPYFVLDSVLKNGVFFAANKLYGLTFKPRTDIPVYADGVKVYEVIDRDGSSLALFYTDYFRRPTKNGGAWMENFIQQSFLFGRKPVIYNVCNFPAPAPGAPAFLTSDNVETLFHEFGHALHGFFAAQRYESISGTQTPRDFVEMPSQFNEHWMTDSVVLRNYARHYQTGEPMPQALIDKLKASALFNQAYSLGENLGAVALDMAWNTLPAGEKVTDVAAFEQQALNKLGIYSTQVPPRYRSPYFLHVFGGEYAAGYYSYLWTQVLESNIFDWFVAHGGMTAENGQRLRELVLSRGNSRPVKELFTAFTGLTEPDMRSLIRARGLDK